MSERRGLQERAVVLQEDLVAGGRREHERGAHELELVGRRERDAADADARGLRLPVGGELRAEDALAHHAERGHQRGERAARCRCRCRRGGRRGRRRRRLAHVGEATQRPGSKRNEEQMNTIKANEASVAEIS